MSVRDLHNYNTLPVGFTNTNLTLTALQLEACQPIRAGGNNFRAFCPFHGSDHQRSLRVNGDSGHFNCFACGAWGYTEEARERWKEQRQNQNLSALKPNTAKSHNKNQSRQTTPTLSYPSNPQPPLRVVNFVAPPIVKRETTADLPYLAQLLEKYQAALPGSWGEEYLRRRKIPLELARRYGVGYAPPGEWAHTARDWKFGRLVFPHTGPDGHILNLYGRAVGSNEKVPKTLRHDHLQGEKGYFNASVLSENPFLEGNYPQPVPNYLKVVRPDGQNRTSPVREAPKKSSKNTQYNTRRITQETSMVLSILNRWGEQEPEVWQANHDSLNRSIQAIRDTLLELAELLAEAGGANLEQK